MMADTSIYILAILWYYFKLFLGMLKAAFERMVGSLYQSRKYLIPVMLSRQIIKCFVPLVRRNGENFPNKNYFCTL